MSQAAVAYISIGNSDDKLPQQRWSRFVDAVDRAVRTAAQAPGGAVHGMWFSASGSPWQNACWALQLPVDAAAVTRLRETLAGLTTAFDQDSIAWAVAPRTEFIGATADHLTRKA